MRLLKDPTKTIRDAIINCKIMKERKFCGLFLDPVRLRPCAKLGINIGKVEVTRRQWIRSKQLLNNLTEKRRHWNFKAEALTRTVRGTCCTCHKTDYIISELAHKCLVV
jgi:hypothetical protein